MENLGWAILDGICTRVLVDNGARVNSVMPAYICQHNLGVHPISELDHSLNPYGDHIPLVGLGSGQAEPLGFTLMRVQIEGMPHYDEHQVLFVLDDPSAFSARIPVILGTPTINRVIQTMKETEMHNAPAEWQMARVVYEWAQGFQFHRASLGKRLKFLTNTAEDPLDLNEKVLLTDKCTIPGFQSVITHGHTQRTMMMGNWLNIMMQAPYPEDKADLPNGLYVMRTYTELKDGSWNVSLMLQNLTARPIYLARGRLIGRVAAANAVPEAQCSPELLKQLDDEGEDKLELAKLPTQQRQELLLAALKKDGRLDRLKEWPPELAKKAVALLLEFHHIFSLEPNEIGCTNATKHVIELMKDEPFKERFRRIAPPLVDEVCQHIQEMLDSSAIRPSQSPWCNAMVLVRKKDGSLRFCIDFCRLNARTKKDAYPLPHMQETMESMVGTQHFSCMDLKSGFWQVRMDEESRQYTAFTVGSMGIYEFLHMPYSLCNAPATFQCLMQNCLGELNLMYALIYLDDVIVYSKTKDEHLVRLRAVLERFMENSLKLKPSKCNFFHTEINYLGHKVSMAGMEPGTEGLKGITEITPPATYTQVHKFLGAMGYFRHFIKGYARIAKPLNDLLQGENSKFKFHPVRLPPDALAAFQELKMKCLTVPVLAFVDFKKPFLLETDTSIEGLEAVLSQEQDDGRYHPVAYASRGLKGGKLKYHSSKLEFLALKWAMTEQFREYLQYQPFLIRTDNNPLTCVLMMPNLDTVRHRWVAAMAGYNFEIQYVCGQTYETTR